MLERPSDVRPEPTRYVALAALIAAETTRLGDRIGYQHTIIDILGHLDEVERGRLEPAAALVRIADSIAQAAPAVSFDAGPPPD